MSNPTRYQNWSQPLLQGRLGMEAEQEPDPDPEDPIDYASQDHGGALQVGIDVGTPAKVQDDTTHSGAGMITGTFGATPAVGNTLIAILAVRGWTTTTTMLSSGWTAFPTTPFVRTLATDGGRMYWWYKTAGASESTSVAINATDVKDLYIAEYSGLGGIDTHDGFGDHAAASTMTSDSITPAATAGVLFAGFVQASRNGVLALQSPFTEDWDVDVDASGPSAVFGHQIVSPFSGSYSATATSDQSDSYGSIIAAFAEAGGGSVWFPAPAANDGDTGTSAYSDGIGACLRVALDVERLIYRMELDIGMESAGATVFELYGTDDPTFASPTLLGTLTFTATGSYTMDSEVLTWVPEASYAYYQLEHVSGGGNEREFFEVRMYSAVGVIGPPMPEGTNVGDILAWNGTSWAVLAVGSNGEVLTIDTTDTLDLDWQTPAGGGTTPVGGRVILSAGNYTGTTGSFGDVTGASITKTTLARRVRVGFVGSGQVGTNSDAFGLDITIDGSRVGGTNGLFGSRISSSGHRQNASFTYLTDVLSAGSHTFKLQSKRTVGSGTVTLFMDSADMTAEFWVEETLLDA